MRLSIPVRQILPWHMHDRDHELRRRGECGGQLPVVLQHWCRALMEFVGCAGEPFEIKKAVCLHEEDAGIVWKHTELRTMHPETRRSRRLVISTMATVGVLQLFFTSTRTAYLLMVAAACSFPCLPRDVMRDPLADIQVLLVNIS